MDESFSSVIKNLKLKRKTPLGQKVKKSKEEDRSNRLLMRFKKKWKNLVIGYTDNFPFHLSAIKS